MTSRLPILALLALAMAPSPADAQSAPKIRPVWWQPPAKPVQLYVEGPNGKPQPIRILQMCLLESFKADPAKGAVLLRREEADPADPAGKPRWVPFVTATPPAGADEALMVLLPAADGKTGAAKLVPLDAAGLPWGGTRLVNLTSDKLVGLVDAKRFAVGPGESATLPFVAGKRTVVDVLIGTESAGQQKLVFSSKGIFTPDKRTILFILRNAAGKHETRSIEEPNPNATGEIGGGNPDLPPPPAGGGTRPPAPAGR